MGIDAKKGEIVVEATKDEGVHNISPPLFRLGSYVTVTTKVHTHEWLSVKEYPMLKNFMHARTDLGLSYHG